ncbi:hypothetical protein PUN28_020820 [Cardiocondyla obscurior]|uniref:Uncharacterized protein n=1 Tax=Cardiocondyla obscurior TaxID=286306 RepID=A0AAW2E6K8_9HYME
MDSIYNDCIENHIDVTYPAIGRIYIDSEPYHEVQIKHIMKIKIPRVQPDWIDPEEINIIGFINIKKKYARKNERRRDREYNRYIWMGPHEGGDVFGLRNLFNMEEDIAFAPKSWN